MIATRIEVFTKEKVLLQLTLSGDPQRLALAFAQQDLALSPATNGGAMILSPHAGSVSGTLAPPGGMTAAVPVQLAPLPSQSLGTLPMPPASAGAADAATGQTPAAGTVAPISQ